MAVIYQITNMVNGKYYIGSAESFARREWQHKYDLKRGVHKNPRLQAAWNKYGADAFVFEVLEEVAQEQLLQTEDAYLVQHVGRPECYNINTNAFSPRTGAVLSEVTKQRISASRKGQHSGDKHYRYGKTLSPEIREKIGVKQRGKPKAAGRTLTEEGRAKVQANIAAGRSHKHWLGRTHTEAAKTKMRKKVIEVTTNTVFDSLTATLDFYGLKMPTLRRALLSETPLLKGPHAGLCFKYLDPHRVQEENLVKSNKLG